MSLEILNLPPIVLQQLFKDSLVDLKNDERPPSRTKRNEYATLGNNEKEILILISSEEALYLPDDQLNFLVGILSACGLTMNDVAILNTKKNTAVTYDLINQELKSKTILLFGVTVEEIQLPITFPDYQVQKFNNQVYLTAPILSQLQSDKAEKSKLWSSLKQIFSI